MLTGADLLAKVADLGQQPRDVLAIACGYVRKNGKANIQQFSDALMTAHGIALPPVAKRPAPSKGKPLSWNVAVSKTGVIPISGGYAALIGVGHGDRVDITHNPAGTLTLSKASTGPAEAPADAPVVVTITEPAVALEGALAPF